MCTNQNTQRWSANTTEEPESIQRQHGVTIRVYLIITETLHGSNTLNDEQEHTEYTLLASSIVDYQNHNILIGMWASCSYLSCMHRESENHIINIMPGIGMTNSAKATFDLDLKFSKFTSRYRIL